MKLDEAQELAKLRIQEFAEPKKEMIAANKDRFVLTSWKADDTCYIGVSIFSMAAMAAAITDDSPENRAVPWLVVRVAPNGETHVEETRKLEELLDT